MGPWKKRILKYTRFFFIYHMMPFIIYYFSRKEFKFGIYLQVGNIKHVRIMHKMWKLHFIQNFRAPFRRCFSEWMHSSNRTTRIYQVSILNAIVRVKKLAQPKITHALRTTRLYNVNYFKRHCHWSWRPQKEANTCVTTANTSRFGYSKRNPRYK